MTKNAKYFTFTFDFFEFRLFALFFDKSFGEKDNKFLNFFLTNCFRGVIVSKNKNEVKVMKTYRFTKHDMQNSWLAKYDYDTCRSMPLYSHRKK